MRRGEDLRIWAKVKGLAVVLTLCGPAAAADYVCGDWDGGDAPAIRTLSISKSMITFRAATGPTVTARMFYGTLRRNTYLLDDVALIVYGTPERRADGTMGFGRQVTLQRFVYDPETPTVLRTTCEAAQ